MSRPIIGNIFFLVCLGFMLFPITPSFLGEELLLSSIHSGQWLEISLFGIGFFLMGVNITRLFAKVFFGPHKRPIMKSPTNLLNFYFSLRS
jgi:NADH:ubiquinone oxidoreductase subunit 4 (subunit M)